MFNRYSRRKFYLFFLLTACILLLLISSFRSDKSTEVLIQNKGNYRYLPYYFSQGVLRPPPGSSVKLRVWPEDKLGDRILDQLLLTAPNVTETKTIYAPRDSFDYTFGSSYFKECVVNNCRFVESWIHADAVIFRDFVTRTRANTPQSQIWILYALESPYVSGKEIPAETVNWTATYRLDSDIVTPYEKWVYYDDRRRKSKSKENFAAHKSKKVAWFVSNCATANHRLEYVRELQNYIEVDIYGACGEMQCSRKDKDCFTMLEEDYKFYLAFENCNCRDYITEKFFVNALQHNVLPIVMGAHPMDYKQVAPEHSYIHVDDFPSARDLADYLNILDTDDFLYNSYFRWKGMGEFINTRFFCRLCAMLHNTQSERHYADFRHWWARSEVCRSNGWLI